MMAYIFHVSVVCGGGERLSLEAARALRGMGIEVSFFTTSAGSLRECAELLGIRPDFELIEVGGPLGQLLSATERFVRLRRLLLVRRLHKLLERIGSDGLVIDTISNVPLKGAHISYIHYPAALETVESNAVHWRMYNWLVKRLARELIGRPRLVLTNSSWTANKVKEVYGVEAHVLYPPADVNYFAYDGRPKGKVIVTVSRITPEKGLWKLPRVASQLPDYEWYLVGTAAAKSGALARIKEEIARSGADNFHIITNAPRNELRELLLRASFYVHPPFAEHFGIAVVEAMAAGAIPIVYRDGGAWTDIVSPISEELGYSNPEEIPSIIRKLEANEALMEELRKKAIERSREFSSEAFRRKFSEIISGLLSARA